MKSLSNATYIAMYAYKHIVLNCSYFCNEKDKKYDQINIRKYRPNTETIPWP